MAVLTSDLQLLDQVLSSAAAAGLEAEVVPDATALRSAWGAAAAVVVGIDRVPELARLPVTRRSEVYLVGADDDREALLRWSVPLGAAVVVLPSGATGLTATLSDAVHRRLAGGRVVAVLGGVGGVGASTCAAALSVAAVRRGVDVVLVDADPWGGGLDLLMGAEGVAGWRWAKLAGARGHLGDLSAHLPAIDGVQMLSASRGATEADAAPDVQQLAAVLTSTARSHTLTVVDLPRDVHVARQAAAAADLFVLVVRADVRGVAAARQLRCRLDPPDLGVLVRSRRSGSLLATRVAESLGGRLLGVVPDDVSLRLAAERGDPPGRAGRGSLARLCGGVVDALVSEDEVA